jgi:hypothetical protein
MVLIMKNEAAAVGNSYLDGMLLFYDNNKNIMMVCCQ